MDGPNSVPAPQRSDPALPLGFADQACKECRRRKSKCNKGIPACNLCLRYRRHCLYEKHSRTPLTRKHLTEVEERLEQAEALIRHMRSVLPPHLQPRRRGVAVPQDQSPVDDDALSLGVQGQAQPTPPTHETPLGVHGVTPPQEAHTAPAGVEELSPSQDPHAQLEDADASVYTGESSATPHEIRGGDGGSQKIHENVLESPPSTEDFEWDEQETVTQESPGVVAVTEVNDARQALDASGAALLRILEPPQRKRSQTHPHFESGTIRAPLIEQPNPNKHIADTMIDAYFRVYHLSYPIIHEPTFRAQYSEVIKRPNGDSWFVLAYVLAAIGVFTTATTLNNLDLELFARAKSLLSFDLLEIGNLTMVQALTLISNYQQKRDKPNSAYSYLGLATRMAMGLGLHKEFQGWRISPLSMEIRRRVWWTLCVFDVGATITFSRPQVWPFDGVEISLPMNVNDKDLTVMSKTYPPETKHVSTYTAVRTQASFHMATDPIYIRVISKPLPTAEELIRLEEIHLEKWVESVPAYFSESASVPAKFAFAHAVMQWRYRNLRMIMYRPFVIRRVLLARGGRRDDSTPATLEACERCLADAKATISSITEFWEANEHIRLVAWYALYFLFQAALIPCICLQNTPLSPQASDWREQIAMALHVIEALAPVNPSAARCHQAILGLCGPYLNPSITMEPGQRDTSTRHSNIPDDAESVADVTAEDGDQDIISIDENSQNQINAVFTMMWPDVPPLEASDLIMGEDPEFEFDGNGIWATMCGI